MIDAVPTADRPPLPPRQRPACSPRPASPPAPPRPSPEPATDGWGIDLRWVDAEGTAQTVGEATVQTLRSIIGRPPADLDATAPLVLRPGASLDGSPGIHGAVEVACEDGTSRRIESVVPADFPLGYHRLRTADGRDRMLPDRMFVVSPGRCWLPEGWRAWGWTVQLYAVRSSFSWGFGDLADLGAIREWAQAAGAGFLLVNPLHAVAPTHPQEPSPYLPASRRFRNPLYLRVEDVPGADLVNLHAAQAAGRALSDLPLIDRDSVWRVKRVALQLIFDAGGVGSGDADAAFARWRVQQGRPLEEFATWCALAEAYGFDFHNWPAELRRPDGPSVAGYRVAHEPEIAFHAWLQWALDQQIRAATEGITVLQDLPIGVDGGGADAWAWQDQIADGVRIGAPPDLFNTRGQNWGSPPLIPWRMRATGYEAFIAAIRATMAATGGLRIDHVMGLFRLWWVPAGGVPTDGAYVRYPSADLLNIVALESHRAQAIVVGEDLGTVEPGVREALAEHRILSYKLLWFEAGDPSRWPTQSMAAVTTHDLPTVAGLWSGADLTEQRRLNTGSDEDLLSGAAELRARLSPSGLAEGASPESAVSAAYTLLARSPSTLLSATLEDAVADERRPNLPGVANRPNAGSEPTGHRPNAAGSEPTGHRPNAAGSEPTGHRPNAAGSEPTGHRPNAAGSEPTGHRPNAAGSETAHRPNWSLPMPVRIEDLPAHPVATDIATTLNAAVHAPPIDSRTPSAKPIGTRGP